MSFKLCSFNVNGLNDNCKRKRIYDWAKEENIDLLCVQESHCGSDSSEAMWKSEWGDPNLSFFFKSYKQKLWCCLLSKPIK